MGILQESYTDNKKAQETIAICAASAVIPLLDEARVMVKTDLKENMRAINIKLKAAEILNGVALRYSKRT